MEIPGLLNNTTGNLKQKKIISWALVDWATDESSGLNSFRSEPSWWTIHRRAIKSAAKPSTVIGLIIKHADCHITFTL